MRLSKRMDGNSMQLHTLSLEDFTQAKAEAVIKWCTENTVDGYSELTHGHLYSHKLKGFPNIQFMEGLAVPSHTDNIKAHRPILFLNNPSGYILRYDLQAKAVPWKRGDLAVLNLDEPHLIDSLEAQDDQQPWQAICYGNPERFKADTWGPEEVGKYAMAMMKEFVEAIIR